MRLPWEPAAANRVCVVGAPLPPLRTPFASDTGDTPAWLPYLCCLQARGVIRLIDLQYAGDVFKVGNQASISVDVARIIEVIERVISINHTEVAKAIS